MWQGWTSPPNPLFFANPLKTPFLYFFFIPLQLQFRRKSTFTFFLNSMKMKMNFVFFLFFILIRPTVSIRVCLFFRDLFMLLFFFYLSVFISSTRFQINLMWLLYIHTYFQLFSTIKILWFIFQNYFFLKYKKWYEFLYIWIFEIENEVLLYGDL